MRRGGTFLLFYLKKEEGGVVVGGRGGGRTRRRVQSCKHSRRGGIHQRFMPHWHLLAMIYASLALVNKCRFPLSLANAAPARSLVPEDGRVFFTSGIHLDCPPPPLIVGGGWRGRRSVSCGLDYISFPPPP